MPKLMRQTRCILRGLRLVLAAFGAVVVASNCATAQQTTGTLGATTRGIEHVLYLAVRSDPASPLVAQANGDSVKAKLALNFRISAHSQETNFFGSVPATVSEFDLVKGSRDQEVWRDGKCHHERGYPKITVTNVDGSVTSGPHVIPVAARYRQLGLFVPRDEVMPSRRLDGGSDDIGAYLASRTETKQSRLFVDLKLYILPCNLAVAAQH